MLDRITRTRARRRPVLAGAFLVVLVAVSGFGGPAPVAQAYSRRKGKTVRSGPRPSRRA